MVKRIISVIGLGYVGLQVASSFSKKYITYGYDIDKKRISSLKKGFDIDLTSKVSEKVNIPVIAHGGAGSFEDIYKVIKYTNISGVGLASILHYEALNYFPKLKPKVGNINFLNKS